MVDSSADVATVLVIKIEADVFLQIMLRATSGEYDGEIIDPMGRAKNADDTRETFREI